MGVAIVRIAFRSSERMAESTVGVYGSAVENTAIARHRMRCTVFVRPGNCSVCRNSNC